MIGVLRSFVNATLVLHERFRHDSRTRIHRAAVLSANYGSPKDLHFISVLPQGAKNLAPALGFPRPAACPLSRKFAPIPPGPPATRRDLACLRRLSPCNLRPPAPGRATRTPVPGLSR